MVSDFLDRFDHLAIDDPGAPEVSGADSIKKRFESQSTVHVRMQTCCIPDYSNVSVPFISHNRCHYGGERLSKKPVNVHVTSHSLIAYNEN